MPAILLAWAVAAAGTAADNHRPTLATTPAGAGGALVCDACGLTVAVATGSAEATWQLLAPAGGSADPATADPVAVTVPSPLAAVATADGAGRVAWDAATAVVSGSGDCPASAPVCSINVTARSAAAGSCQSPTGGVSLEITQTFWLYPSFPGTVRSSARVAVVGERNASRSSVTLTHAEILNLGLAGTWAEPQLFHMGQRGHMPENVPLLTNKPAMRLQMGAYPASEERVSQTSWVALHGGARAVAIGLEFNGKSTMLTGTLMQGGLVVNVVSSIDRLNVTVDASSPFAVPPFFAVVFAPPASATSDEVLDEAGWRTQHWVAEHIAPKTSAVAPKWPLAQFNSWQWGTGIDEEKMRAELARAVELGLEAFVLDFGWVDTLPDGTPNLGNWWPDAKKFPTGLKPLSDAAHAAGMFFGVHMALPQVNVHSRVAAEHPDWLVPGAPVDYFQATGLCLCVPAAAEWLTEQIVSVIDTQGVDYIVTDGEDVLKRCPGVCADDNYNAAVRGYDAVVAAVRARRPRVVWEACEDGGNLETFAMARLLDTSNSCDNSPSYKTRQGAWQHSYAFSPVYGAKYVQDPPTNYTYRSAMFGGPLILQQRLQTFSPAEMATAGAMVREFKRWRDALWQDPRVTVHHLAAPAWGPDSLPPPPLTPAAASDPSTGGAGFDAIQAVSGDRRTSVVFVYRARLGGDAFTVKPRGLDASALYAVRSAGGRAAVAPGPVSGAALMAKGVNVTLPEATSEVVEMAAV